MGPTIISNMTQSMEAYKNEIFGPVLCVLTVDTLEEAIELINRSVSREALMLAGFGGRCPQVAPSFAQ